MAKSNRLATSNEANVKDVSLPNSGGVIERGNAAGFGSDAIQGAPIIPNFRPYPEVAEVEGDGERCSAVTADHGGEAGPGTVREVATKSVGPAVAYVEGAEIQKAAGVKSHPSLMRAHQLSSITKEDAKAVKCGPVTFHSTGTPQRSK